MRKFVVSCVLAAVASVAFSGVAQAGLVSNGDFEAATLESWTADQPVAMVVSEGDCNYSFYNTRGIMLPGDQSMVLRSPGYTSDTAILTSDPLLAGVAITFDALQETAGVIANPATFTVAVLDASNNQTLIGPTQVTPPLWSSGGLSCASPEAGPDGVFGPFSVDTSGIAGTSIKIQFTQHTNQGTDGYFTLLDNVARTCSGELDHLAVEAPAGDPTAGGPPFEVTVTAYDECGEVAGNFDGEVTLSGLGRGTGRARIQTTEAVASTARSSRSRTE